MNHTNQRLNFALSLLLLATLSRLAIPPFIGHVPNFSALNAIALFSGAYFLRHRTALLLTFLSVLISDFFINKWLTGQWTFLYAGWYWQYASYLLVTLLGSRLTNHIKPLPILFACLASTLLFFIISNFGVWLQHTLYPLTINGLLTCYIAAIPFLKNSIIGDLFFTSVLFYGQHQLSFMIKMATDKINTNIGVK